MNNDNLTPNDHDCFQPDTNTDACDKSDRPQITQPKPTISEARLRANRENSKQSTGPKTARGKGYSRRNAVTHGLLMKKLLFSDEGKPQNEELRQLWESLHEKYGKGDIRTLLLVEGLVVEYWRQRQALAVELICFQSVNFHFGAQGFIPNLQRYRTASLHAFLKHLELLDKLPPPAGKAEEDEPKVEPLTPQPENPPSTLEPGSALTVVAAD
jgi:hypothetical protein